MWGRLLDTTATGSDPVTIRDHAILSLLIHYGLRRGEVERLTLDDIDWSAEVLHVTRPKVRRVSGYPLAAPVGDAILRYLREARPRCSDRAVFLTIKAPHRPLSGASISAMVKMRLVKQGVTLDRIGAHCLRHACAGQLMEAGFTLKQIADHLGHRSMSSTTHLHEDRHAGPASGGRAGPGGAAMSIASTVADYIQHNRSLGQALRCRGGDPVRVLPSRRLDAAAQHLLRRDLAVRPSRRHQCRDDR